MFSKNLTWSLILLAVLASGPAHAQAMLDPSPLTEEAADTFTVGKAPDVNAVPILQRMIQNGASLHYLGRRSGLDGWFIVKEGKVQMIYVTADQKTAMLGAVFTEDGTNVTSEQIKALAKRDSAVSNLLNHASDEQRKVRSAGTIPGGSAVLDSLEKQKKAKAQTIEGLPAAGVSPGDQLYRDLELAASVNLGSKEGPVLMMVVSPDCPNCKGTWQELKSSVKQGEVRVLLVPVFNEASKVEAATMANLLTSKDPMTAWDAFSEGDKKVLDGPADKFAVKAVEGNLELVKKWNIKSYPYLVYRDKEGKVKIVQGRPERIGPILFDMAR